MKVDDIPQCGDGLLIVVVSRTETGHHHGLGVAPQRVLNKEENMDQRKKCYTMVILGQTHGDNSGQNYSQK